MGSKERNLGAFEQCHVEGQGKRCHSLEAPFLALTLQGLPSTVCSSNSSPILKLISVVRTVVEVLM